MGQYLDKFKSQIGQKQTEQIIKLLNQQRNSGQIRTIEEFSKKLENLVRELTDTVIKPTSKLYEAEVEKEISTESYNFMLDRAKDDLDTAFTEALNIDEVQNAHEAIVRDVVLKNLRSGLAELDSKITLYEFLNKDTRGFNNALFTTFRESKENRTFRGTTAYNSILFLDPRKGDLTEASEDAAVELIGERLTLSPKSATNYTIRNVTQLFDDDTPQSELIVDPPNISLSNIIDGTKNTYWAQSLIYQTKREFVKTKLELDLGIVREINRIEIEPASRYPIILESITYLDGNNVPVVLNLPEQEFVSTGVVQFKKIASNKIILTFRNEHPTRVQFEYDPSKETLFSQALQEPPEGVQANISDAAEDLNKIISSGRVKSLLGVDTSTPQTFIGYEYQIGFDNIRIGVSTYSSRSIYVSSPLKITGAGQIGLKVDEKRPYTDVPISEIKYTDKTYDNLDENENAGINSRNFLGSIEYWIVKQDLSTSGSLIKTSVFPILPLEVERVHHERLVLNEKSSPSLSLNDIGTLMFFTNVTDGELKVYRNFELLTNETDNLFATDGWKLEPIPPAGVTLRTPNQGARMRLKIKIVAPLATDIYTVSYTPLVSTTAALPQTISEFAGTGGIQVVDLTGDLSVRAGLGQIVYTDIIEEDQEQLESRIYLVILLRQNTAEESLTSIVEEYTLVVGYKDREKLG
jgi:hypothetical protein